MTEKTQSLSVTFHRRKRATRSESVKLPCLNDKAKKTI